MDTGHTNPFRVYEEDNTFLMSTDDPLYAARFVALTATGRITLYDLPGFLWREGYDVVYGDGLAMESLERTMEVIRDRLARHGELHRGECDSCALSALHEVEYETPDNRAKKTRRILGLDKSLVRQEYRREIREAMSAGGESGNADARELIREIVEWHEAREPEPNREADDPTCDCDLMMHPIGQCPESIEREFVAMNAYGNQAR